jgi:hypothetical protein
MGGLAEPARVRGDGAARGGGAGKRGVAARRGDEHAPAFGRAATGLTGGAEGVLARGEGVDRAQGAQVPQGAAVLGGGGGASARPGPGAQQGGEEEGEGGKEGIDGGRIRARVSSRLSGGFGRRCGDRGSVHGLFL